MSTETSSNYSPEPDKRVHWALIFFSLLFQRRAQQLYNIQSKFNPGIPGSKAVFELLTGIKVGPPRLPLHGFSGAKRAELSAALQEVGFLWDVFGDSTVKFE